MSSPKVLIVGASGRVGGVLLSQLIALTTPPPIRISTRDPTKLTPHPSIEVVQGDLEDATSYARLFNGISSVFLYANDKAPLQALFAAAKDGGVKRIVLISSMTVDFDPNGIVGTLHRKVEDAIKDASLLYTFIRPRNFSSNSRKFWAPTILKTGKLWITYPDAQTAPVSDNDIAAVALTALTTDKLVNKAVGLSGTVSISQREQVYAISRLRERENQKPVELIVLSPEDWKVKMSDHMPADFQNELLTWWRLTDGKPEVIQSSERVTGKPSESYEEWLEYNKDAFLDA